MLKPTTFALVLLLPAATAMAQQADLSQADQQAIRNACSADIRSHCTSFFTPNATLKAAITACMKQNIREFSQGCKRALIVARLHQE